MQASSAVISLAWASGPRGHGLCHARLSEAGRLSWEQPLGLGQAHLILRDLTPGRNLSLSILCQAGPLQASTHPVVLPVGMSVSVGGEGHKRPVPLYLLVWRAADPDASLLGCPDAHTTLALCFPQSLAPWRTCSVSPRLLTWP